MKLKNVYRWILGLVGVAALLWLGISYYINRMLALKYFPDVDWIGFGVLYSLVTILAGYFILAAISGGWRLWFGR